MGERGPGRWAPRLVPWATGLVAGVLALGPALGRGYVLRYDMVFVPDLSLAAVLRGADGFPRAIPSDAVVAALSAVLPGGAVQSLALLSVFAVGGAGAARLLLSVLGRVPRTSFPGRKAPSAGMLLASAAAGAAYVWNPFVAERLLLGQWAMLLGYAGLPWAVAAAARLADVRPVAGTAGLLRALVPAAVGGFSSVVLTALTAGPTVLLTGRGGRSRWVRAGLFGSALVLVSLPWLLPSLVSGAATDPAGVEAFAARADTPLGTAASLLMLGGVWNSHAVPAGYAHPVPLGVRVLMCLAALVAWVWVLRRERPVFGPGLTVAAVLGLVIALAGTVGPGRDLLAALISAWPGFGPLRDGQLYVAPLALVQALGLGAAAHWLTRDASASPGGRGRAEAAVSLGAGAGLVLLPLAALPGLLWGAAGALAPAEYPQEWLRAQAAVAADERPGAVLVLPWSAYRGVDWSGEPTVVLDPATKLFDRRTLWNDDLVVGASDGAEVVVEGEDARAREAAEVVGPDPRTGLPERLDASALGGLGVRYVVVSASVDNQFWLGSEELSVVVEGPGLTLLEVPDPHIKADKVGVPGLEVTSGLVTVGAILWSIARSGSSLNPQRFASSAGAGTRKEIDQ
ncbi:hypothetical protein [Nocardiopsis algeriensis]|uniref:Membrane protein YfhO n=1 Tax=Nocardiopsis algeriensis TaxID=1478215 RepID=A0A841IQY0_9ACTN|nr:hypothetical protein [Nocardiopsis algeriensis]